MNSYDRPPQRKNILCACGLHRWKTEKMPGKELTALVQVGRLLKISHATVDMHTCRGCDQMWTQFNYGTPFWKRALGWGVEKIIFFGILAGLGEYFGLYPYVRNFVAFMISLVHQ